MSVFLLGALSGSGLAEGGENGFISAYRENPLFLTVNFIVLAICVAVIAERFIFQMAKYRVNSHEFFAQVKKLVTGGNLDRAVKLCDAGDYPTLQLVKSGLVNANKGADEIDAAMSEKMSDIKPPIEKRLGALWSLANIATLIGLLGTVYGLIHTFSVVSNPALSAAQRQQALANGIAEAMYNTALGLFIAVVCMIAHLILQQRAKNIQHDLESIQERIFNLLTLGRTG